LAPVVPTCEPTVLTAGDSHEFTRVIADYPPSDGWTLAYSLILADRRVCPTVTDDSANEYTVTFAADDLATITADTEARLVGFVTGSGDYAGERHTVYDQPLTIRPNPSETTLDAMRSQAELELVAVNAAILELTTAGTTAYSIGGHTATKIDLKYLYQRQAMLESRIRQEQGFPLRSRRVAFV
jgi:hypothetical protein